MRKFVLILSLILGFVASAAASDLYTHTTAEPERSFMVAATWWLPDYQSDTRDFAKRSSGNDKVAGDIDNTCANYNKSWQTTVGADMECDAVKPLPNLTCYKNCRCKNVVSVGTGEQCNRYCLGSQCVSKSCKAGVSVGSGETCSEKCASNSGICTAKRCNNTVSVGTGEQCTTNCGGNCVAKSCKSGVSVAAGETCTERCASNSNICTAKSCNATVSVGTGEQCNTTCGGNCVAKSCKGSVTVSTGEQCTQRCASNSGICTAKSCKSTATVNTGEYCTERCAADNSCTAKACKGAVSVGTGETCNERCSSNSNTCTAKACNSGYLMKNGVCLSDTCPLGFSKNSCNSTQIQSGTRNTDYGSVCYSCRTCNPLSYDQGWVTADINITEPYVTLSPTGATGTGDGTCALATGSYIRETAKDECGRDYKRICHKIYPYNGWQIVTTPRTCASNQTKLTQSDGCGTDYDCCQNNKCVTYLPVDDTFKYASMWQKADYNGNIQQQAALYCYSRYANTTPIIASENCGEIYFACLINLIDKENGGKVYVSCDTVRSMNFQVYQNATGGGYIPCVEGVDSWPFEPQGPFVANGYVPTQSTITGIPDWATGTL